MAPGFLLLETQKTSETLQKEHFSYRTIARPSAGAYREKGSRFLAFAYPVTTEDEVKAHIDSLQKKYFDARHHCFAWMLGTERKSFRAFDDGEPNHSAGDPILRQIRSKGLTNVLIVVVRYFGGVKLGLGGLITAYKATAEDALNHAEIVEKDVMEAITITYDYSATPGLMRLVKEFNLRIGAQNFESACELRAEYKLRDREKLIEKLQHMTAIGVRLAYSL